MNYTIVAYKPNGEDTCRGCVMSTYNSDFFLETFTDPIKAAEKFIELENDPKIDKYEPDWEEIIILFNGKDDLSNNKWFTKLLEAIRLKEQALALME
jgi:hypothetical protein